MGAESATGTWADSEYVAAGMKMEGDVRHARAKEWRRVIDEVRQEEIMGN